MKDQIKQFIGRIGAIARELDWRSVWQTAIPLIISGAVIKALGG